MAKKTKAKKGKGLDSLLEKAGEQKAREDAYQTPPPATQSSSTPPPPSAPRKKQVKVVEFPRTIVGLFTEAQYAMVEEMKQKMKMKDGGDHSLNGVIRVAVEKLYADFDK
jgi:hypothetical protein